MVRTTSQFLFLGILSICNSTIASSLKPVMEHSQNASLLCSKLSDELPGKAFLPNSSEYVSSVDSYFFRTARQTPACVLTPNCASDVEAIVKILAANPGAKFAIRSGGHTPNPQQSNVDNGVTIDLRGLKAVEEKDGEENVISVGTGAEWGDVYDYLENKGRVAVGSRESSVGVGGFITGELGFACDNVVNMQVVTPKGIMNANAHENEDLFRAIRGGQGNFGIVTRFDIKTYNRSTYWGGGILYPDTTEDAQLQAWSDLKQGEYDPYAAVVQSYLYFGTQKAFMVSNNMVYLQQTEKPTGLAGFEDIQPQVPGTNTMRLDTTKNFALELQAWQPLDQYAIYVTTTIKFSPTLGKKMNSIWREATESISDSREITSVLTYQQFPPQDKSNPNGMGLDASDELHKDHLIIIISVYWHEIKDSERIIDTIKGAMDKIEATAAEQNSLHPFKYMNYAAFWQQPPSSYGEEAHVAANEVSAKYDPDLVFRKQAVGFKYL